MIKKQIVICFENRTWLCDYINIEEGQSYEEVVDNYMRQYEQVRNNNMEIVKLLLPAIINISVM